ncbi:MAG: dihydrodipicolinate synthase family protein [Nitrospinaceae bacterium]|nr:dihydrodipicolinate synthase family protein [Nitrospinaceae bacterium]
MKVLVMSVSNPWRGLFPATVLPCREDFSIDEEDLRILIRFLMGVRGVSGLACNGHAGDAWALTREERDLVTQIHVEEAGGQILVIAGVSGLCTRDYVEQMGDAKASGAAAVLVLPPPLFRGGSNRGPDEPVAFIRSLAEAVDIPIVLFQHMIGQGNNYSAETMARLAEIEAVVAVKDAVGDYRLYEKDLIALLGAKRRISILNSSDVLLFPCGALGHNDGSLISLGTLMPHWMVELIEAFWRDDLSAARAVNDRVHPVVNMFYNTPGVNNAAFIKEALHMLGVLSRPCVIRPPHRTFDERDRAAIRSVLDESGLTEFYKTI